MAYLTSSELTVVYPAAAQLPVNDVTTYLARANAYAKGVIGGNLPAEEVDDDLRAAVALAFEIMAKGEVAQADPTNGNITEVAPAGFFVRKTDPLAVVKSMLQPYAEAYDRLNAAKAERGIRFL